MELDLARLFATLHRHKVVYVLIGGLAAVYHGSPFPTEDADITPEAGAGNLTRLAAALRELNARIRTESVPEGLPFTCDAQALSGAQTWNLATDAGDLDIAFEPAAHAATPTCTAAPPPPSSMTASSKSPPSVTSSVPNRPPTAPKTNASCPPCATCSPGSNRSRRPDSPAWTRGAVPDREHGADIRLIGTTAGKGIPAQSVSRRRQLKNWCKDPLGSPGILHIRPHPGSASIALIVALPGSTAGGQARRERPTATRPPTKGLTHEHHTAAACRRRRHRPSDARRRVHHRSAAHHWRGHLGHRSLRPQTPPSTTCAAIRDATTAPPPELATTAPPSTRVGAAAGPIAALPAGRASALRAGHADSRPLGATGSPPTAPTPGRGRPPAGRGADSGSAYRR